MLLIVALVTLASGYFAVSRFSINSDTGKLIRQDTAWKATYNDFQNTYPQYANNTFVVISGAKMADVRAVSRRLEELLRADTDTFEMVYAPENDVFLEDHALLFLSVDDLDTLVSNLADAQPVLTAIARDPGLRGLFTLFDDALGADEPLPPGMAGIFRLLADNIHQTLSGHPSPVAWRDEMLNRDSDVDFYSVIFVQGAQNFGISLPNARIIGTIRDTISSLEMPQKDLVSVRLSGQIPLDHGEIESAMNSAQLAGSIAAVVLLGILVFGVGSLRVIIATYLAMIIGLICTAAYATLAVGQYNTISIIFLVMFIGLGVDFAIHISLRYQEELRDRSKQDAIETTTRDLGPAISLCGITSAIGFLAFVPTEYIGLAELGIISGGGMIIAVIVSLTVIPAFFTLVKDPVLPRKRLLVANISLLMLEYRHLIVAVTLGVALLALFISRNAYFDYSTLSLKDQNSEAMTTFRELQDQDVITDFVISYVAASEADAAQTKARLMTLDTVSEVKIPRDYVPVDQEEKRFILEDAQIMLASTFYQEKTPDRSSADSDRLRDQAISQLAASLEDFARQSTEDSELSDAVAALLTELLQLANQDTHTKTQFEQNVIQPMQDELNWLNKAINVKTFTFEDFPATFRHRLIAPGGEQLVTVTPGDDIIPVAAMRSFADEVQSVVDNATGRPIVELGIGQIVLSAFGQAISVAVVLILLVLILALRSVVDSILVLIPLAITTLVTFATSVLVDLPLNMANVVVVPLIFGLGVDNGIHVVERFRESKDLTALVRSSTPRAVFLSTLTTLGTFGALSFSTHQGIYSIGVLLTCALTALLFLTLISLPALLAVFSPYRVGQPTSE